MIAERGSEHDSPGREPGAIAYPLWEELAGDDISAAHPFRAYFFKLGSNLTQLLVMGCITQDIIPQSTEHRANTNTTNNRVEGMKSENTTI